MASSLPLDLTADYYLIRSSFVAVRLTENGSRGVYGFFLYLLILHPSIALYEALFCCCPPDRKRF